MIDLSHALAAYGTPDFNTRLKQALEGLGLDELPLQQGLRTGNTARDDRLGAMIVVRAGLFYTSITASAAVPRNTPQSLVACGIAPPDTASFPY